MNKYTLYLFRPGKYVPLPSEWKGKSTPPLSLIYELLGTDIAQVIPYFTKLEVNGVIRQRGIAWCDEEGIMKHRPLNIPATKLWQSQYAFATELLGPVVIYFKEQVK